MTDKVADATTALHHAIDTVTQSMLQKLESVEVRVAKLKSEIDERSQTLKTGLSDLVISIDNATEECDRLHVKLDSVRGLIEVLPADLPESSS